MNFKANTILYIIAGCVFFLFWIFVVFPYDALQSRVITEIENQTGGRYQIDMKDMDISLFGSVTFEDLKVKEKIGNQNSILIDTPKFELGFSPLGMMSQKIDFTFYLEGKKKGEIEGSIKQEAEETELELNIDEFPLSDLKFLASKAKVGLKGILQGEVRLKVNSADPNQNKGKVDLSFSNLTLDATQIALDPSDPGSTMDIPKINITGSKGSHIKAEVLKDKLEIKSISLKGGDLDLDLDGTITLRGNSPKNYRMSLKGGFKITEALTKAIPFLVILEQQKNADGIYPLTISGRFGKPNVRIGKFRVPI